MNLMSVDHRRVSGRCLPFCGRYQAVHPSGETGQGSWRGMGLGFQRRLRQGSRSSRDPGRRRPDSARLARHRANPGAAGGRRPGGDHGWCGDRDVSPSRVQAHAGQPDLSRPGRLRRVGPLVARYHLSRQVREEHAMLSMRSYAFAWAAAPAGAFFSARSASSWNTEAGVLCFRIAKEYLMSKILLIDTIPAPMLGAPAGRCSPARPILRRSRRIATKMWLEMGPTPRSSW